ncbi:MAG: DUF4249 domain-containing protein [Bacteroidia bacterium]|nr:DUF4249 domain-containing protein [Bacteroidia bacterium]MDW8345465.1 DUF4249 domain-containing protein [Bacteroidia bacterium]
MTTLYIIFVVSCTEEVPPEKLRLKNAEKAIIIEGYISYAVNADSNLINTQGPFEVKVSTSSPYFEKASFIGLSGATVWITDNMGQKDYLSEVNTGIYRSDSIQAIPGRTYTLNVIYQGKTYSASSYMPAYVPLDSVTYRYIPPINFLPGGYYATIYGVDPPGGNNYYRLRVFKRTTDKLTGKRIDSLFNGAFDYQGGIAEDKFFDGNFINFQLPYPGKIGDTIRIELCSIDKGSYDYYFSLGQAIGNGGSGGPFSPPPANPKTNFNNGAYGYFSAESYSKRWLIIQ